MAGLSGGIQAGCAVNTEDREQETVKNGFIRRSYYACSQVTRSTSWYVVIP